MLPRFKFSQRSILLSSIIIVQLACLLGAILFFDVWITHNFQQVISQRIMHASQQLASELSKTISLLEVQTLSPNTQDREIVKDLIEGADIAGTTYVAIYLPQTHQFLGLTPNLLSASQETQLLSLAKSYFENPQNPPLSHDFTIATRTLPNLNAQLLVFQDEQFVQSRIIHITRRVKIIGMLITIIVISLSAFFTLFVFSRYENELDMINTSLENKVEDRSKALLRSRDAVIFGLAKLAESRDDQTGQHLERICRYVKILAKHLADENNQIDGIPIEILAETAALHDIGKVAIPDQILLKPGKLTPLERETINQHAGIGGDTLMAIKRKWGNDPFLITASQIAYAHHERWDGKGYPFGLAGRDIPFAARIVAVADVYDALRTKRTYKDAFSHKDTVQYIINESGKHFDPRIVEVFLRYEKQFKMISESIQDGDEFPFVPDL